MTFFHYFVRICFFDFLLRNNTILAVNQLKYSLLIEHDSLGYIKTIIFGEISFEQTLKEIDFSELLLFFYKFFKFLFFSLPFKFLCLDFCI